MTELGQLRLHYQAILDRGVQVVAVSVDPPEVSEALRQRLGLAFPILSDPDGVLMDALHVRDHGAHPSGKGDIFLPTTFLLDEDGVIRWVYRPDTYRVRATPAEVLAAIEGGDASVGRW